MQFYWSKAFSTLMPSLIQGVGVVLYVTILGFIGAVLIALLFAIGRVGKNKVIKRGFAVAHRPQDSHAGIIH